MEDGADDTITNNVSNYNYSVSNYNYSDNVMYEITGRKKACRYHIHKV